MHFNVIPTDGWMRNSFNQAAGSRLRGRDGRLDQTQLDISARRPTVCSQTRPKKNLRHPAHRYVSIYFFFPFYGWQWKSRCKRSKKAIQGESWTRYGITDAAQLLSAYYFAPLFRPLCLLYQMKQDIKKELYSFELHKSQRVPCARRSGETMQSCSVLLSTCSLFTGAGTEASAIMSKRGFGCAKWLHNPCVVCVCVCVCVRATGPPTVRHTRQTRLVACTSCVRYASPPGREVSAHPPYSAQHQFAPICTLRPLSTANTPSGPLSAVVPPPSQPTRQNK